MPPIGPDMPRGPKRCFTTTGVDFRPYIPSSVLHGLHCCLNCDFTRSLKPILGKQSAKPGNATVNG